MAAPVDMTAEEGEGQTLNEVDYLELLRVSLRQQKLMYIADIVMEVEEESLANLLEYLDKDLAQLLIEIDGDENNNHKIKASHRNKFRRAVMVIAKQRTEASQKQAIAPAATAPSSQLKLLFLGKEEEKAIESIQLGQTYMDHRLLKMKELFNDLDKNNKNVKQNVHKICTDLKQRIDQKQKEMLSNIDIVYQHHLNELKKRNEVTQQSAKIVAKIYNDYELYFSDNELTKSDRKDKLIAAKSSTEVEVDKIKKYKDVIYNMDITLNKESVDQFLNQFLDLQDIGINLPAVASPELDKTIIKWKPPQLKDDVIALFRKTNDDNKEETELSISYRILYSKMEDEKKEDEWNQIDILCKANKYDMKEHTPCNTAIQYTINQIFQSPISQHIKIGSAPYIARWSSQHQGTNITLSDDNSKALLEQSNNQSVRAQHPIKKGSIVKLNYTFFCAAKCGRETVGVVSSEYNGDWAAGNAQTNEELQKYTYGMKCSNGGNHYIGKFVFCGWSSGTIPIGKEITIQMIVDYKTYDTCCLSFYRDGKMKAPTNQPYSMKLPKLQNDYVWYPLVCFQYRNNWCRIECVDNDDYIFK